METPNFSIEDAFLVWIRRISASLSIIASTAIVYMIVLDRGVKLKQPNHRFLLVMSFFDIIQSIAQAFASAPIPSDSGTYGAMGNSATCAAQGFLMQLGLAVPLYNTSLSLYYLFSIRYKVQNREFARKIEPFCHFISISFPLTTAMAGLYLGNIGQRGFICWVPKNHAWLMWCSIVEVILCFIIIFVAMFLTYRAVLERHTAMSKYDFATNVGRRSSMTRKGVCEAHETMKQASVYVAAFFFTFIWLILTIIVNQTSGPSYTLRVLSAIFYPLQGFWNFFVYTRRGCTTLRRQHPERSYFWVLQTIVVVPASARRMSIGRRNSARGDVNVVRIVDQTHREIKDIESNLSGTQTLFSAGKDAIECAEDGNNNNDKSIAVTIQEDSYASSDKVTERNPSLVLMTCSLAHNVSCDLGPNLRIVDTDLEEGRTKDVQEAITDL